MHINILFYSSLKILIKTYAYHKLSELFNKNDDYKSVI